MHNYRLVIEYDGKDFKGWQKQNYTKFTIQGLIEDAIEKLLKEKIRLIGAGRTDSGVSAYNQIANFHFKKEFEMGKFMYSLNSMLPPEITVKGVKKVPSKFHARHSAKRREYIYKIAFEKKSIGGKGYYRINFMPDFYKIDQFIKLILSLENFSSFCKNKEDKNNFLCTVFDFRYKIIKSKNELIFSITASRFLHSMVRAIIGCSLEIGRGKITLKSIQDKINKGEKTGAHYLPANALFLKKIHY